MQEKNNNEKLPDSKVTLIHWNQPVHHLNSFLHIPLSLGLKIEVTEAIPFGSPDVNWKERNFLTKFCNMQDTIQKSIKNIKKFTFINTLIAPNINNGLGT
jgi:hypothetical protein